MLLLLELVELLVLPQGPLRAKAGYWALQDWSYPDYEALRDADTGVFVFRQFLSEGFVNTYEVSIVGEDPLAFLFAHRETESGGGMRAQLRLTFIADDEYDMVLDLASPGEDFVACQQMHLKKVP